MAGGDFGDMRRAGLQLRFRFDTIRAGAGAYFAFDGQACRERLAAERNLRMKLCGCCRKRYISASPPVAYAVTSQGAKQNDDDDA